MPRSSFINATSCAVQRSLLLKGKTPGIRAQSWWTGTFLQRVYDMKPEAPYTDVLLKIVFFWRRLSFFCRWLVNAHALNLTAELEHVETKPSFVSVYRRAVEFSSLYYPVGLIQLICTPSHCWNTMKHCSTRLKIELKCI